MIKEYPVNNLTSISNNNLSDVDFFQGVYANGPFTPVTVIVYMAIELPFFIWYCKKHNVSFEMEE